MSSYHPYHEPGMVRILVLSSFLLLLNVVNFVVDKFLYCGLVGQILLGIAWGTPGGKWIDNETEQVFIDLGYLGLLLVVYEGGLLCSVGSLLKNLHLSSVIAVTGITAPIGISFSILGYSNATPVAAFAAGAALCSTSLGTAFTIMTTSKLVQSRLGSLLTSAAMLDDIAGLVMLQVIANLGQGSFTAVSVIRPVFVSIALVLVVILVCFFIVKPITKYAMKNEWKIEQPWMYFVIHTLILIGVITGSTFAGASLLTAAYVTGAAVSWWDNLIDDDEHDSEKQAHTTGLEVFERYYSQLLGRILRPLFFASVGFSIPITQMFSGRLLWKGLVYALLMAASKFLCSVWIIRIKSSNKYAVPLLGLSMVPRGEIGFLIASLAESEGIFGKPLHSGSSSEVYIIVIWAVVLCTMIAPICVGFLVRKIKVIDANGGSSLGMWGFLK